MINVEIEKIILVTLGEFKKPFDYRYLNIDVLGKQPLQVRQRGEQILCVLTKRLINEKRLDGLLPLLYCCQVATWSAHPLVQQPDNNIRAWSYFHNIYIKRTSTSRVSYYTVICIIVILKKK